MTAASRIRSTKSAASPLVVPGETRISSAIAYAVLFSLLSLLQKVGNPMTLDDLATFSAATGKDHYDARRDMLADLLAGRRAVPVKAAAEKGSPARRESAKDKAATGDALTAAEKATVKRLVNDKGYDAVDAVLLVIALR